jgi:hypothetical protein
MAVELHDRLRGDFNLDRAAAALDLGHSVCSSSFVFGGVFIRGRA